MGNKRESETEHSCAALAGTLPLGEGRSQLGGVPACTQEGSFARSPLLQRPETSNLGIVAGSPATNSVRGVAGLGVPMQERSRVLADSAAPGLTSTGATPSVLQDLGRLDRIIKGLGVG